MEAVVVLFGSSLFWTIVGTVATVIGTVVGYVMYRSSRTSPASEGPASPQVGPAVEEIDSEAKWVEAQVEAIGAAKHAVSLCLHTVHSSGERWKAKAVNAALANAKSRRVEVRVLAASDPAALAGPYELEHGLGVEVRFAPEIRHYDLRFLIIDSESVVVGVANPDRQQGEYSPSHSWAVLRSAAMCEALEREFQRMWLSRHSTAFDEYCVLAVRRLGPVPSAKLALDLGLEYDVARRFASQPTLASLVGNAVLVFHGKTCSGKSKLMRMLGREYGATCLDFRDLLLPYVHRYGADHIGSDVIEQACSELAVFCRSGNFDAIEVRSECAPAVLDEVFESIEAKHRHAILVHCEVSNGVALMRNEKRLIQASAEVILSQASAEETNAYRQVCERNRVSVITVTADGSVEDTFKQVVRNLKTGALPA